MVAHDLDDPHTQTDMTMGTQPLPQTKKEIWINRLKRTPHGLKELVFGGRHFCCCIPTRFGVVVGSCLQFLVAGVLAVILWFEVHSECSFKVKLESEMARCYVLSSLFRIGSESGVGKHPLELWQAVLDNN